MPETQTVTKSLGSISSEDFPEEVTKAAKGKNIDKWYYATVETPDREKDIVRVKGLDTQMYRQHGGPIKILVGHRKSPDAKHRLPIAGAAVEWVPTTHKGTGLPAMAVGFKFVDTELGRESKVLADADLLDVSIGFQPLESQPIKGGGFDYTKAAIGEISICTHGMNQYAGQMKSEDDAEALAKLDTISGQLTKLSTRLDEIECAIVAKSQESEPTGDQDSDAREDAEAISELTTGLKVLVARLSKPTK